jgi:transposase
MGRWVVRNLQFVWNTVTVPNLWKGAVGVMDNLPAHKLAVIEPLIQAAGASILNLSPYSPDFNPIELWW